MYEATGCEGVWGWYLGIALLLAAALIAGFWLGRSGNGNAGTGEKKPDDTQKDGDAQIPITASETENEEDEAMSAQVYSFETLNKLSVSGCWQVDVDCGTEENFCKISADPALIGAVKVEQERGGIKIRYTGKKRPVRPMLIEVRTRQLIPMLKSSGENTFQCRRVKGGALTAKIAYGGRFIMADAAVGDLTLKCSGSSSVECGGEIGRCEAEIDGGSTAVLTGKFQHLKADVSGASKLEAENVHDAELEVSGASRVKIQAEEALGGSVSGASTVKYTGGVQAVHFRTSGSSRVKRMDNE